MVCVSPMTERLRVSVIKTVQHIIGTHSPRLSDIVEVKVNVVF